MIMEAILFSTAFTGGVVGIYRIVLYLYHRKIKENQALVSITKLDKDLWKLFSRYVRLSAADWKGYVTCFTCPTYDDWRTFDAGHYLPQALGISVLKYHLKNVHPQCVNCNRLKGGNYTVYKQRLILHYGEGIIKELNDLRNSPPMTITDYQTQIKFYSAWLKSH